MNKLLYFLIFCFQFSFAQVEYTNAKILLKYKNEATGLYEIFDPLNCLFRNSGAFYTANRIIIVNKTEYDSNGNLLHIIPNGTEFKIYEEWNNGNMAPFISFDVNNLNNHIYNSDGVPFVWHSLITNNSNFYIKWGNNFASIPINNFSTLSGTSSYMGHFENINGTSTTIPINQNNEIKLFYQNSSPNPIFNLPENTTIRYALYANDQTNQTAIIRGSFQKNNAGNILTNLQPGFLRLTWNNSNIILSNNMNNYCTHTLFLSQNTIAIGNSRSIKITANNIDSSIILGNFVNSNDSSFLLNNNHILIHHPVAKFNNDSNFYSMFSEFDENLCFIKSKKVPYLNTNHFYNAIQKPLGGFAINSYDNLDNISIRNYDANGAILYSKKYNFGSNEICAPYHKLVASEQNNNLFLIRAGNLNDQNEEPIYSTYKSLFTDVVEIDNLGNVVSSFRIKLPKNTIFNYNQNQYYHLLNASTTAVTNALYVKGPFGIASDRIWVALSVYYGGSLQIDNSTNQITGPYTLFNDISKNIVLVINPNDGTSNATIIDGQVNEQIAKFIIESPAIGWNNAKILMSLDKSILKFNDHYNSIPNNKYNLNSITSSLFDFKKHNNTTFLSDNQGNFINFNPSTLSYIQRKENVTDANYVIYNKFNSNDLFLNYSTSNVNYIIKQPAEDFDFTCLSTSIGNYTATQENPIYFQYSYTTTSTINVSSTDEVYQEIVDNTIFTITDICGTSCNNMGLNKNENLNEINFYPNPTKNFVTIDNKIDNLKIYNSLGQEMELLRIQQIDNQTKLDLSTFANGIYFIKFKVDTVENNIKIIKE